MLKPDKSFTSKGQASDHHVTVHSSILPNGSFRPPWMKHSVTRCSLSSSSSAQTACSASSCGPGSFSLFQRCLQIIPDGYGIVLLLCLNVHLEGHCRNSALTEHSLEHFYHDCQTVAAYVTSHQGTLDLDDTGVSADP